MLKVSVIIPIYNVEEYLKKCLDTVVNQTYKNLEIICVNDCSPDNSLNIIEEYQLKDNRIKLVNRKQNGGLSAARNSGLDIASGDYIYFLDSDDYIDLDYIETMLNAAIKNNAEVVLNTNIISHKGDVEFPFSIRTYNNLSNEFIDSKQAILNILWNTWAHLWKKTFLDRINARFPEGYIIEDQYFQAITYIDIDKVYVTRDSKYHYTMRDNSIMGGIKKDVFYPNLKILNKIFDYYVENNKLDKLQNVRMITEWIFPQNGPDKYNQFIALRDYFSKIQKYVNNSRQIYAKYELALFDDLLSNINKAMTCKYANLYVLDYLRSNLKNKEQKMLPIFLSSDNNYAPFLASTIASICDNTKSNCKFYILDGGITSENQQKIQNLKKKFINFSIEFIKIDSDSQLKTIDYKNKCEHVSISTYNRFLIPELKPTLNKILYLDVDIIALGDIRELFQANLEGCLLGAISETNTNPKNAQERCDSLQLNKTHKYFNAGVLLFDIQDWIKNGVAERLFKTEKEYRDKLFWADQDILNIVFNNQYKELSEKYNFMTGEQTLESEIIIRHFNTDLKPWQFSPNIKTSLVKNSDAFWKYIQMTEFYEEVKEKCLYKTQDDINKLRMQRLMGKINANK